MAVGEYSIVLKVRGGEKFQYQQLVKFQVHEIPYLLVDEPNPLTPVPPAPAVTVRARLLRAGKPCRPQEAFTNHPDQLVIAQVQSAKGSKAEAVWMLSSKGPGKVGEFVGTVPVPAEQEGIYTLVARLAPEEPEKQKVADASIVRFEMRYPPTPVWRRPQLWLAILILLTALVLGLRWWVSAPLLTIYYQTHDMTRYYSLASRKRNEKIFIHDLGLEIHRPEKERRVIIRPKGNAQVMLNQEQTIQEIEIATGGGKQFRVKINDVQKTIVVTVGKPPLSRPEPPSREREVIEEPIPPEGEIPSEEGKTPSEKEEEWRFE